MKIQIRFITTDIYGDSDNIESSVYGLGEDNKVYYWSYKTGEWKLHKKA